MSRAPARWLAVAIALGSCPAFAHPTSSAPRCRIVTQTFRRTVHDRWREIQTCYRYGLTRRPSLRGRVAVEFIVARSGEVTAVRDAGSDIDDAIVVTCVLDAFRRMHFDPIDADFARVRYPIVFSPLATASAAERTSPETTATSTDTRSNLRRAS